jgi:hypothetical protein
MPPEKEAVLAADKPREEQNHEGVFARPWHVHELDRTDERVRAFILCRLFD